MIRALIIKNIARLKSIPALMEYLKDNKSAVFLPGHPMPCGHIDEIQRPAPLK